MCIHNTTAQKYANIWYFGNNAGLNFNTGKPVAIQGQMVTSEGCATISDNNGKLLFYTNGMTVWNRNNNIMLNGSGLDGSNISAQSGIIIPMPGDNNKYYIFTAHNWTDAQEDIQYSVVDMALDGGLGGISSTKDVALPAGGKEELAAVYKDNCTDIWVLFHRTDSRDFYAYSVTSKGVDAANPVISTIGSNHTGDNRYGYLKFSHDNKKLVSALGGTTTDETVEVFDFDTKTGKVSNQLIIATANSIPTAYCAEFSPDNSKLYVTAVFQPSIYQYDLSLGSQSAIQASRTNIATGTDEKAVLQLGPDNKIYVAKRGLAKMDVIDMPDKAGNSCNFHHDSITLATGTTCAIGLPNFLTHLSSAFPVNLQASRGCGNLFSFNSVSDTTGLSCEWNFDDPASGNANISHAFHPVHAYKNAGVYHVTFSCQQGCKSAFAAIQVATSKAGYSIKILKDTFMYAGDTLVLDAGAAGGSYYQWQDGSQKPTFIVSAPGIYWVIIKKDTCRFIDSVKINLMPGKWIGNRYYKSLCAGKSIRLSARYPANCLWSTGSTDSFIYVNKPGLYTVKIRGLYMPIKDSFIVAGAKDFNFKLGRDTVFCEGNSIILNAGAGAYLHYLWQDGSTDSLYHVSKTGKYLVKVGDSCTTKMDSIMVQVIPHIRLALGMDTTICNGDIISLQAMVGYGFTYKWQDGNTESSYKTGKPGTYYVTISSPCGTKSDTIHIDTSDCTLYVYIPSIFSPDNDGLNDVFKPSLSQPVINYHLMIYNRWGERLFESSNAETGWDGTFKGAPALENMYRYQLTAVDKRHKTVYRSGRFYLVRH